MSQRKKFGNLFHESLVKSKKEEIRRAWVIFETSEYEVIIYYFWLLILENT